MYVKFAENNVFFVCFGGCQNDYNSTWGGGVCPNDYHIILYILLLTMFEKS